MIAVHATCKVKEINSHAFSYKWHQLFRAAWFDKKRLQYGSREHCAEENLLPWGVTSAWDDNKTYYFGTAVMRIWFNHHSINHLSSVFQTTPDFEEDIFCPFLWCKSSSFYRPGSRAECSWISQTRKWCMLSSGVSKPKIMTESQVWMLTDISTQKPVHAWLKCEWFIYWPQELTLWNDDQSRFKDYQNNWPISCKEDQLHLLAKTFSHCSSRSPVLGIFLLRVLVYHNFICSYMLDCNSPLYLSPVFSFFKIKIQAIATASRALEPWGSHFASGTSNLESTWFASHPC